MSEKVRLGGMALANGVLVHGPHAWACAVRASDGQLKVVARRKAKAVGGKLASWRQKSDKKSSDKKSA